MIGHLWARRAAVLLVLLVLLAVLLVLAACAPGPNPEVGTAAQGGGPAGFWLGLWHGVISPFTFLISLFTPDVRIYEVHNNGAWYDFGFVLGAGILLSGGLFGARRPARHTHLH